jgi:hypothetical protein
MDEETHPGQPHVNPASDISNNAAVKSKNASWLEDLLCLSRYRGFNFDEAMKCAQTLLVYQNSMPTLK